MMDREKEELVFQKRIQDLAGLADRRGCILYSDFLSLNEQAMLHEIAGRDFLQVKLYGGYEGAERRMAAFFPYGASMDADTVQNWPVACIRISPLQQKFADDLTHRDFLGALMHLGIERSMLGDIAVMDAETYLFCSDRFAPLICRELTRVRRTSVSCSLCRIGAFTFVPQMETIRGSVSSIRLDSVTAQAFHTSRSSLIRLIEGGSVFVNGRLITTNAYALKEGDLISVRGYGRFRYVKETGLSRKGRCWIEIQKYI